MRRIELTRRFAPAAPGLDIDAILVKFRNAGGCAPSAIKISPAASHATSEGPLNVPPGNGGRPAAAWGAAGRTGLLIASGFLPRFIKTWPSGSTSGSCSSLVHHPDVVLTVHANGVRLNEAVKTLGQFHARIFRSGRIQKGAMKNARIPGSCPWLHSPNLCACRQKCAP